MYKMNFLSTRIRIYQNKTVRIMQACWGLGKCKSRKSNNLSELAGYIYASALVSTWRVLWIFSYIQLLSCNLMDTTALCFPSIRTCACNKKLSVTKLDVSKSLIQMNPSP